jgi:hypothetical protein
MHKAPDCVGYNQPDAHTAKIRREMLQEWTGYIEQMVRLTDENRAACRRTEEEFLTKIRRLREDYEAGDKGALLSAIQLCFSDCRPVPIWAMSDFCNAIGGISSLMFTSWDEVFGRPLKKGAQPAAIQRRRRLATPIMFAVRERRDAGEPISMEMFEAVAKEIQGLISKGYLGEHNRKIRCGPSLVRKIYNETKNYWDEEWPAK